MCHHVCDTAGHVLTDAASHHMDSVAQVVLAGVSREGGDEQEEAALVGQSHMLTHTRCNKTTMCCVWYVCAVYVCGVCVRCVCGVCVWCVWCVCVRCMCVVCVRCVCSVCGVCGVCVWCVRGVCVWCVCAVYVCGVYMYTTHVAIYSV